MEHWSAIYALVARRRIHDFTLRKAQSDRLLGLPKCHAYQRRNAFQHWFVACGPSVIVYAPVLTYRHRLCGPCVVDGAVLGRSDGEWSIPGAGSQFELSRHWC
jgi:hypothetical protein